MATGQEKLIILHLGDPVKYKTELCKELGEKFTIIRPTLEERQRDAFLAALKQKK
jgi:hypothetical protein